MKKTGISPVTRGRGTRSRSQSPPDRFARKPRIAPPDGQGYAVHMQTELQNQWQQVLARDARQDGRFVFAVRTTGIYCRPSCPSRRPRRDSVEFFADPRTAERAGYRACLRCKPTEVPAQAQYVTRARQLLDNAEGVVTLAQLSQQVGLSPFHLATAVQARHRPQPARIPIRPSHAAGQDRTAQRRRCDYRTL